MTTFLTMEDVIYVVSPLGVGELHYICFLSSIILYLLKTTCAECMKRHAGLKAVA